jgi:hypothetical protein
MPLILLAGAVISTESDHYPLDGQPSCTLGVRVPESAAPWRVIGYDDVARTLEAVRVGDQVAITGTLHVEASDRKNGGRTVKIFVVANNILPIAPRSAHKAMERHLMTKILA